MIVLRLLHILSGVAWVGSAFFMVTFLEPAVSREKQAGGRVMAALGQGPLPKALPILSMTAVFSGIWLYWIDSAGFQSGWMRSATGTTLTIGGLAAVIAVIIGMTVQRPAVERMAAVGRELAASGGPPSPAQAAELTRLGDRTSKGGVATLGLLTITTIAMAIARYL